MSYVIAAPEMMTSAATDLATIGSNLSAAHTAVVAPTVALVPAAADEVSAGITHLFSQYAGGFQALAGKAAAFHDQFVQNLTAGAGSYASIEAASASMLQNLTTNLEQVLNSLFQDIEIVGLLAVFGPIVLALYVAAALRVYLTTGQFLSWSAFVSETSALAKLFTPPLY